MLEKCPEKYERGAPTALSDWKPPGEGSSGGPISQVGTLEPGRQRPWHPISGCHVGEGWALQHDSGVTGTLVSPQEPQGPQSGPGNSSIGGD